MSRIHTHYDNLKVARNAPPEVIRAAYKTLSQKFHPDRNPDKPNATRTFQLISVAYEVLSDPIKRQAHDDWIAAEEEKLQTAENPQEVADASRTSRHGVPQSSSYQAHFHAFTTARKEWLRANRLFKYFFWLLLPTLILLIAVAV